tara:strand:+ start:16370 stop:16606 length:237 start_codon:yes stop_codon:yes gene_type:complete
MESVYETFFFLKYSGGWSFSEAYNLPVGLRKWFTDRLVRQLEMEKEAIKKNRSGKGSRNSTSHTLSAQNQPTMPNHLG